MKSTSAAKTRLTSLTEDISIIPEDAPYRSRLHYLFAQIEKEFEQLYLENLNREYRHESNWFESY